MICPVCKEEFPETHTHECVSADFNALMNRIEKFLLVEALDRGESLSATARRLGLFRPNLYSKMKKHGLIPGSFRKRIWVSPEGTVRFDEPSDPAGWTRYVEDSL